MQHLDSEHHRHYFSEPSAFCTLQTKMISRCEGLSVLQVAHHKHLNNLASFAQSLKLSLESNQLLSCHNYKANLRFSLKFHFLKTSNCRLSFIMLFLKCFLLFVKLTQHGMNLFQSLLELILNILNSVFIGFD